MSECRLCGRSGFFTATDKNGLCGRCSAAAAIELAHTLEQLNAMQEHLRYSRSTKKRLADCDQMLQLLEVVRDKYESKGVFILKPVTADWATEIGTWREPIVIEGATSSVERAFENVFASTTVKTATHYLRHVVDVIADAQAQLATPNEDLATLAAKAERLLSATMQTTDEQIARNAARIASDRHSEVTRKARQRLVEAGIDLVVVLGGPHPCADCQALIDDGPYSLSGTDPAHVSLDAAIGACPHFGAADCCCCIVADTSALDEM
jgi:hypothetical protein